MIDSMSVFCYVIITEYSDNCGGEGINYEKRDRGVFKT